MIFNQDIDKTLSNNLRLEFLESLKREPSGKQSASRLYWPYQWQVLHLIGVPQREPDDYSLRKFARGHHVEDFIVKQFPFEELQKRVEYRSAMGLIDAVGLLDVHNDKKGIRLPVEIKSVTNAKYKRLQKMRTADPAHRLQGAFYAKGLGTEYYAILYVASDDYRVICWVYNLDIFGDMVDEIITEFEAIVKTKKVPVFTPREEWQRKEDYNPYFDWMDLTEEQIHDRLKTQYPDSYKKLQEVAI